MAQVVLPAPLYSQRDPRWAGQRLGWVNSTTIGSDGCVITAAAMLHGYYGKVVLPNALDNFYTDNKFYVDGNGRPGGNLFVMGNISKYNPAVTWVKSITCKTVPAPISEIKTYIDAGKPVFVWVVNEGVEHCTMAVGYDGNEIIVHDPWRGDRVKISDRWGNSAAKIIYVNYFTGPVPASATPTPANPVSKPDMDRADGFNKIVNLLHSLGKLPTNKSEDWLTDNGKTRILAEIQKLADDQKYASEWDRICIYLEFSDPRKVTSEDVKRVIAGYKSRTTELENRLTVETSRANAAEQEVVNQRDKVANIEADCQKRLDIAKAEYEALKKTAPDVEKLKATYTATIDQLRGELREAQRQGGIKDLKIKELESGLPAFDNLVSRLRFILFGQY